MWKSNTAMAGHFTMGNPLRAGRFILCQMMVGIYCVIPESLISLALAGAQGEPDESQGIE
jgi:hypothetical protein